MQIYADKLQSHLNDGLASVYLVASEDSLLRDDASRQIRAAAKKNDINEIQTFVQDAGFSWEQLLESCSALSLFAEKRLIELKLASAKIGKEGSQAVVECINIITSAPDPDTVLLVNAPRIEGKPAWVNEISSKGIYVPIYPPDAHELPKWLIQRATSNGLRLSREAAELLAERVEGNLVSAVQELEKLALLASKDQTVSAELVETSVLDNARYSAFNMLDRAIDGESRAACKALQKIREEGTEGVAITGAIAYQVRTLLSLIEYSGRNQLAKGFKAQRVRFNRQKPLGIALKRLTATDLENCIHLLGRADYLYKTGQTQIGWQVLEAIVLRLAGKPLAVESMLAAFRSH